MIYDILYPYQKKIVNYLKQYDASALFTDTGTGKSYMSISIYQDKYMQKKVNKCLVICLLGKVDEWVRDFKKFQPLDKVIVLDGKAKTMKDFTSGNWDVAVINFEKTWRLEKLLTYIDDKCMIIIDESHKIKTPDTKQGKFIGLLGQNTPYKLILTATPMGNGYIDLYNQLYFLGYLDMAYKDFQDEFCIYKMCFIPGSKPFEKIDRYRNTEVLDNIISKYAYFYNRPVDESMLPSELIIKLPLDKNYNRINRERVYKDVVLDTISAKRMCLKSLCSGNVMGKPLVAQNEDSRIVYNLNTYKLDWVKTFLETFNKRVVIFYQYTHQMEQLYDEIKKTKRSVARYNAKYKEKDVFEANDDCVLLCQYKSGGTGIDWLKKSYVGIFYSLPDSYIEFYQAKGRIDRNGQTEKPLFYILLADGSKSVDMLNWKALSMNQDFNDEFFSRNFSEE